MAPEVSRVKREQLRKRLKNLLRRHNDFWRLYSIRSWVVMEMPNGRLYTYYSHPDISVPTRQDIVRVCSVCSLGEILTLSEERPSACSPQVTARLWTRFLGQRYRTKAASHHYFRALQWAVGLFVAICIAAIKNQHPMRENKELASHLQIIYLNTFKQSLMQSGAQVC